METTTGAAALLLPGKVMTFLCPACVRRPFPWKGQIFLSHWLALPPGQERAALARLDLERGALEHVYRFEVLQEELAKELAHTRRTRTHDRTTSTLEQARALAPSAQPHLQQSACCSQDIMHAYTPAAE